LETFALNRQALAFLAVIAVLVLTMVFLSPFLLFFLGGLGVLLLLAVWLKAALRVRNVAPAFGAAEGALALSALLFVIGGAAAGGLMVARVGYGESFSLFRAMLPVGSPPSSAPRSTRSVRYPDPDTQERLKQLLAKAGVPFTVEQRSGEEWIGWPAQYNAAAEAVQEKVQNAVPNGRNVFFPNEPQRQKEFTDWLTRKGIKYETVREHGREMIVWEEGVQDPVKQFMAERGDNCRKKC
jgi:hypothetical protein